MSLKAATVVGVKETKDALRKTAQAIKQASQKAMFKAAAPIVREMKRRAPVGPKNKVRREQGNAKRLKNRIRISKPRRLREQEVAAAYAKATAPHSNLIEKGTKARKRTSKGNAETGRIKPKPFVAPAAEATKREAAAVFEREFHRLLEVETDKIGGRK